MAQPSRSVADEDRCEDTGFDEMPVEVETELIQYEADEVGEDRPAPPPAGRKD